MAELSVVLVTGVNSYWGAEVALKLLQHENIHVIGLDDHEPAAEIKNLEFIAVDSHAADLKADQLTKVFKDKAVDVICHLKPIPENGRADSAQLAFTNQLFHASLEAGVQNLILRSSISIYGARRGNPAFFKEDAALKFESQNRNNRSFLELEHFYQDFKNQNPKIRLAILRFANIVGPRADSPMFRFLKQDIPVVLMGFDPRFQLIHEDDVAELLAQSAISGWSGTFNIAAEGSMPLSRILRLVRKVPIPVFHPLVYGKRPFIRRKSKLLRRQPLDWDFLRYSCIADTDKMRDELLTGFAYTAEEALLDFSGKTRADSQ